jgi:hypothetical protein
LSNWSSLNWIEKQFLGGLAFDEPRLVFELIPSARTLEIEAATRGRSCPIVRDFRELLGVRVRCVNMIFDRDRLADRGPFVVGGRLDRLASACENF